MARFITKFDIPDDIAGKDYFVEVGTRQNTVNFAMNDQYIRVSRGFLTTDIALSGNRSFPQCERKYNRKGNEHDLL